MRTPFDGEYKIDAGLTEKRPYGLHGGEDWNLKTGGNTDFGIPLLAITDGLITDISYSNTGFGNAVQYLIEGPFGYRWVEYDHCLEINVQKGQQVKKGQQIARMGGKPGTPGAGHSTAAHLHWVVRKRGHLFRAIAKTMAEVNLDYEAPSAFLAQWAVTPAPNPVPPGDDGMKALQKQIDEMRQTIAALESTIGKLTEVVNRHDRALRRIGEELAK